MFETRRFEGHLPDAQDGRAQHADPRDHAGQERDGPVQHGRRAQRHLRRGLSAERRQPDSALQARRLATGQARLLTQ